MTRKKKHKAAKKAAETRGSFTRAVYAEPSPKMVADTLRFPDVIRDILKLPKDAPVGEAESRKTIKLLTAADEIWLSDKYQVAIVNCEPSDEWPKMIHLSIRRLDREPLSDWRELQRIKNELVGKEHEAVELYPAESRRVDGANQTHLWVLADPNIRFPFGFHEGRQVSDEPFAEGKQRPLGEDEK